MARSRVTAAKSLPVAGEVEQDHISGRGDPEQRFRVYRLCACFDCAGRGKVIADPPTTKHAMKKCPECRGESKVLDLVATCPDPQALGVCIVQLGQEGEFEECPIGVLDEQGEKGKKWIVLPWLPSPRNVHDAARVMAKARKST